MSIGRRLWSLHSLWSEVKAGVQVEVDGEDHGGVDVEDETRPLLSMESFPLIPIICDHWICGISNTHFPSTITVRGAYCDVKEVTWFFLIFDLVGAVNPWGLGLWLFDNVLQIEQPCIIPTLARLFCQHWDYYSWTPVHVIINLTQLVLIVVQTRAFGTHQTNTPFLPRWSKIYIALAKFSFTEIILILKIDSRL